MDENSVQTRNGKEVKTPNKGGIKVLTILVVVIIITGLLLLSLRGTDSNPNNDNDSNGNSGFDGVTMRELQLDFDNKNHDYSHYDSGDTVVLIDRISSLEVETGISGKPLTILEFSAKPLPETEINYDTYTLEIKDSDIEDWFTYTPMKLQPSGTTIGTPVETTFDGDIAVEGDISDTYSVGDMVKITLHFESYDVPGYYGNPSYTTEKIKETMPIVGGITADEIEKV